MLLQEILCHIHQLHVYASAVQRMSCSSSNLFQLTSTVQASGNSQPLSSRFQEIQLTICFSKSSTSQTQNQSSESHFEREKSPSPKKREGQIIFWWYHVSRMQTLTVALSCEKNIVLGTDSKFWQVSLHKTENAPVKVGGGGKNLRDRS